MASFQLPVAYLMGSDVSTYKLNEMACIQIHTIYYRYPIDEILKEDLSDQLITKAQFTEILNMMEKYYTRQKKKLDQNCYLLVTLKTSRKSS